MSDADVTLHVPGMACPRSVRAVTASLRDLAGVRTVQADAASATVVLRGDFEIAAAIAALEDRGYPGCVVRGALGASRPIPPGGTLGGSERQESDHDHRC